MKIKRGRREEKKGKIRQGGKKERDKKGDQVEKWEGGEGVQVGPLS